MEGCRIPLAGIGYSTVEAIPFYHFMLGSDAMRVLVPPLRVRAPFSCDFCDVGELDSEADNVVWGSASCSDVTSLARRWGASLVLFDGVEPLGNIGFDVFSRIASVLQKRGIATATRWQGSTPPPPSRGLPVDALLVDYVPESYIDSTAAYRVLKFLEEYDPWRSRIHVEVAVYIEKPRLQALTPLLQHVNGKEIPLHVYVYESYGGGAVVSLYKEIRKRVPYVYLHADPYSELDTECPKCSTVVAVRTEGVLHTLAVKDGRCPKCGHRLLLRKVVSVKTPRRLLRETRGETVWYPLEGLPVRLDFSSSKGRM